MVGFNSRIKVVIDTNIFIHGLLLPKKYKYRKQIMDLLLHIGLLQPYFSEKLIGELMFTFKGLSLHALKNKNDRIAMLQVISEMFYYSTNVKPNEVEVEECNDVNDNMLTQALVGSEAEFLVTDDYRSGLHGLKIKDKIIIDSKAFMDYISSIYDLEIDSNDNILEVHKKSV